MSKSVNQRGITHIVALAGVFVIAVASFAGYLVLNNRAEDNGFTATTTQNQSAKFKNQADVRNASTELDNTEVDSSVDPDQLNDDLDALL